MLVIRMDSLKKYQKRSDLWLRILAGKAADIEDIRKKISSGKNIDAYSSSTVNGAHIDWFIMQRKKWKKCVAAFVCLFFSLTNNDYSEDYYDNG